MKTIIKAAVLAMTAMTIASCTMQQTTPPTTPEKRDEMQQQNQQRRDSMQPSQGMRTQSERGY